MSVQAKTESAIQPDVVVTVAVPDVPPSIIAPAKWFTGLSSDQQRAVRWVAVATLKEHSACDFVPRYARSYAAIRESIATAGILFPLGVDAKDKVIDGIYRFRAARELGLDQVPVLTVDLDGADVARWVFELKEAREHLDEHERAVLAYQFQQKLKGSYTKVRSAKALAGKNRKAKGEARHTTVPPKKDKQDSRKLACEQYKVSERMLRATKRLADNRPDLYGQVVAGNLDAAAAMKTMGKNKDRARAIAAIQATVRSEDIVDDQLENRIHEGEAQDVLKHVPDGIASLVLFSPAYFGADVPYDPPLQVSTYEQYKQQLGEVLTESFRISRTGGRLAIVLDTTKNPTADGDEMLPLAADVTTIARSLGWRYWTDIVWVKPEVGGSKTTFGSLARCSAPGWGRDHEWVLLFFKNQKKLEGNPELCDLERDEHMAWWRTTWKLHAETRRDILAAHPAPFPETLAERLIKLLTYRRDLVVDPYNGAGTTTAVAQRLQRRFIGIDRPAKYCAFARTRCGTPTRATSRVAEQTVEEQCAA